MDDTILKIQNLLPEKELESLQKILIYQETDGSYKAYGTYSITKNIDGIYTVSVKGTYTEKNFYKLKNALAWCSFDKRMMYRESNRLHQLDQLVFGVDTEIQIHSRLMKKAKNEESTLIYLSKLLQNKAKKRSFTNEITNYIGDYQRWQNKMFNTKPSY